MRKYRQLHLWIGLICSILILVESVTGLLLSEPWLMGSSSRGGPPQAASSAAGGPGLAASEGTGAHTPAAPDAAGGKPAFQRGGAQQGSGLTGWVHQLHEGRIGSTNLKWLADAAAIGMIILTLTGIVLSVQTLRGQRIRRRRRSGSSNEPELT